MRLHLVQLVVLALLTCKLCGARPPWALTTGTAADQKVPSLSDVKELLTALSRANLFGGMVHADRGGKTVVSKGYGQAVPEHGVPMGTGHHYAIGSNTKLFTAAAMWQLHARSLIHINDTIDKYLTPKDMGLDAAWCPRVINATGGPCRVPSFVQLLSMQSGLLDTDNCRYAPTDWQAQYCWSGPKGAAMPFHETSLMGVGAAGPLALLRLWGIWDKPLQAEPGTEYFYVNANFIICAAVLEKVTGMSTQQYFRQYIFKPVGLASTYFDTSNGNDGLYWGMLHVPGFLTYLSPLSLGIAGLDWDAVGNGTATGGDMVRASQPPEGPPFGVAVKLARPNSAFNGFAYNYAHAAGAIISTNTDMATWFRALTRQPEKLGLSSALVRQMLTTGIQMGHIAMYAQGVVTVPDPTHPLGASHLFYVGNLGYDVVHYIALDSSDPANDLHVSTVGYLTPFTDLFNFTLSAPTNNSPEPNPKLSASATAANNGDSVCLLSLANDPLLFTPMYGGNGGWPTRSQAAYDYFLARARAAGSAAANRPVPAPHVLCDAGDEGGMSQYLTKLVAEGLVGRPWFT